MSDLPENQQHVTIKLRGLGHQLSFSLPATSNLFDLHAKVEEQTGLPPPYQRLIIRGKTLDGDMTLKQFGMQPGSTSKAILMHSQGYKIDQDAMEKITQLNQELDLIEMKKSGEGGARVIKGVNGNVKGTNGMSSETVQHLITDICCKLDLIDLHGSDTLRQIRRKVLKRAESIEKMWNNQNDTESE